MYTHQTAPLGHISRTFPPPRYELLAEEPELQTPGQDREPTVITVHSSEPPPRDFIVWSLFNTVYMNFCCLGFMALVFSVKARDRKVVGDLSGARSYGSTAKCLNICALTFTLLLLMLFIFLMATGIIFIKHVAENQERNPYFDIFSGN